MIFFEKYLELSSSNLHAYILYIFFLYLHIYFFTDSFSLFFLCTLYIYIQTCWIAISDGSICRDNTFGMWCVLSKKNEFEINENENVTY